MANGMWRCHGVRTREAAPAGPAATTGSLPQMGLETPAPGVAVVHVSRAALPLGQSGLATGSRLSEPQSEAMGAGRHAGPALQCERAPATVRPAPWAGPRRRKKKEEARGVPALARRRPYEARGAPTGPSRTAAALALQWRRLGPAPEAAPPPNRPIQPPGVGSLAHCARCFIEAFPVAACQSAIGPSAEAT